MRLFGHPVHLMLVHFPVALWPAHWVFHATSGWLPSGLAGVAGFWLLLGGTVLGWVAAVFGLAEVVRIRAKSAPAQLDRALLHGGLNSVVLLGFTVLLVLEGQGYPDISHGRGLLTAEAVLLGVMLAGNHLGGTIDWRQV